MLSKGGKSSGNQSDRRHPRHSAKGKAKCTLGDVLDLSAGGMRVACDGKPALKAGSAATVNLRTNAGTEAVNVRCCWVRKTGLLKGHQIGLKFIGITDEQSDRIGKIAKFGFLPEEEKEPEAKPADDEKERSAAGVIAELDLSPYYQALELEPGATADDVRTAYRKLVRTCHPDVCDAPDSQARFMQLKEAYDMLRKHAKGVDAGEANEGAAKAA